MTPHPGGHQRITFFLVGATRAGTTSLDALLRSHPEVEMAIPKEPHYFDSDEPFRHDGTAKDAYAAYHRAFRFSRLTIGEATPAYIFFPKSIPRIHTYNPQARIIALLRNPVDRAHSHWAMGRKAGVIAETFKESLLAETMNKGATIDRWRSNIARGRYSEQIKRIRSYFPADRVLFLKSEDFYGRQGYIFGQVCDFLGISRMLVAQPLSLNGIGREALAASDRDFALSFFADDILKVEEALGWDCSDWRRCQ